MDQNGSAARAPAENPDNDESLAKSGIDDDGSTDRGLPMPAFTRNPRTFRNKCVYFHTEFGQKGCRRGSECNFTHDHCNDEKEFGELLARAVSVVAKIKFSCMLVSVLRLRA